MHKVIRKDAKSKPEKPCPEFPLFPHTTRRWAKKIRGKLHYFGPWDDADGAIAKYPRDRDALHAGLTPRVPVEGVTIRDLVNRFLASKKLLTDSGDLLPRTHDDYYATCERPINAFGKDRFVVDLASDGLYRLAFCRWAESRR